MADVLSDNNELLAMNLGQLSAVYGVQQQTVKLWLKSLNCDAFSTRVAEWIRNLKSVPKVRS